MANKEQAIRDGKISAFNALKLNSVTMKNRLANLKKTVEDTEEYFNTRVQKYVNDLETYGMDSAFDQEETERLKQALQDIANWDDDLNEEWGDPGKRAKHALNVANS